MPSLGPAEILVILVVALLVFGPNKMPEIGRQVARGVREFRRVQQHLSSELQSVVADLDPTAPAPASSGGDPVPTLPPKDITETSAADAPAAVTPVPDEATAVEPVVPEEAPATTAEPEPTATDPEPTVAPPIETSPTVTSPTVASPTVAPPTSPNGSSEAAASAEPEPGSTNGTSGSSTEPVLEPPADSA